MEDGKRKSRKRIDRLNLNCRIFNEEETRDKSMISQLLIVSYRDEENDINKLVITGGIIHA